MGAGRSAFDVRAERLIFHIELVNRPERNGQPHILALNLIEHRSGVHPVEREVIIIEAVTGETDRSLVARTRINGTRDQRNER